ncbi:MAG: NADH-quinone oxidoreductase subunit C, partial [Betaproteobacteria bacterium]|nr:NADH-quinone oxidoreductase subunit C [Betaproteobacteria bacterium]
MAAALAGGVRRLTHGGIRVALGEVTLVVAPDALPATLRALRDRPEFLFATLIDLCGVDYSTYGDGAHEGRRFAVVYHLLSLAHNCRLRGALLRDRRRGFPLVPSAVDVWPAANWFER